jgi:hypothetical protein
VAQVTSIKMFIRLTSVSHSSELFCLSKSFALSWLTFLAWTTTSQETEAETKTRVQSYKHFAALKQVYNSQFGCT